MNILIYANCIRALELLFEKQVLDEEEYKSGMTHLQLRYPDLYEEYRMLNHC